MNEEEKEAIKTIESFKNMKWYNHAFDRGVEILTEEERREIDIVINLIEKQQKEINFYKVQELGYIQGYEDGKSHKQTAVAKKNEYEQEMLIQRKMEEYEKEIKFLKSQIPQKTMYYYKDYISKDKIKEKIELLKDIKKTNCYKQLTEDYLKGAIEQLKDLLGETNVNK